MPFAEKLSRFKKWPWSRVLILGVILVGLVLYNAAPDGAPGRTPDAGAPAPSRSTEAAGEEPPRGLGADDPTLPALPAASDRPASDRPASDRPASDRPASDRPAGRAAELPVWQRPPRTTAQPFPEAARFDPPQPPMKIPPEMVGSASTQGDAAVRPDAAVPTP